MSESNQTNQPAPVANEHPAVWDLVLEDIRKRDAFGQRKYGVRLQPHNGRDVLRDAYEEALDLVVYLRQAIYERGSVEDAVKAERQACIDDLKRIQVDWNPRSPTGEAVAACILKLEQRG